MRAEPVNPLRQHECAMFAKNIASNDYSGLLWTFSM